MPGSVAALSETQLRRTREAAQLLDRSRRRKPVDLIRDLLAVQAQVLSAAGLALAARTDGLTAAAVDRARVEDRSIVHTWAMRGTLHLVTAEDFGWLVPLVLEPRIANSMRRLRQLGLTGDRPEKAARAVEQMLERQGPLTRQEILSGLRRRGFRIENPAVAYHLVWLANSTSHGVCYGPARGRDRCLVLFRDWAGEPKRLDREAALSEMVVRYLGAHGPATPEDLAFWSGLRLGVVRRAWRAIADRLVEVRLPGGPSWMLRSTPKAAPGGLVRLLPNFDEYLLGWKDRAFVTSTDRWKTINRGGGWLHPVVLADGRAAGRWKANRAPKDYRVEIDPFEPLASGVHRRLTAEVERLGAFLGVPAVVGGGHPSWT